MTILAWENAIQSVTASSEAAGLPADNLLHPVRTRRWRTQTLSGDPRSATLTFTLSPNFDGRYPVRSIFLSDTNLVAPTIRIEGSTVSNFASKAIDVTVGAGTPYPIRTLGGGYGEIDYGSGGFGGYLTDAMIAEYNVPLWINIAERAGSPDFIDAKYWRLTITEAAKYNHSTFEAGVAYIGTHHEIRYPWEYGLTEELIDLSATERSEGGTPWTDRLPHYLRISGRASIDGDSTARLFERIAREAGQSKDIWTVWYPESFGAWTRALYGRFQEIHAQKRESARIRTINFQFEESL
jgi:hypothetical protein